jgi:hypothetical protein
MAATGYTPISLYYSTTASAVPVNTNLVNGELAINITDGKLYYKDNSGTVKLLASNGASTPVTTFSAGTTGFTPNTATSGAVTLAGTLNVANGGTGLTSLTAGSLPYGAGTSAFGALAIGTSGQILTSSGTAPQWTTLSGVAVTAISFGTTGLTPSTSTSGSITVAGTLNIANGGTGATSLAGANIALFNTAQTWTATQTFNGSSSTEAVKVLNIAEPANIVAASPSSTTNFYVNSGAVQYYTSNAANNWTVNFAFSSGTALNTAMAVGDSISCTLITTQGSTAYYNSAVQIDGTSSGVTTKWQGGTAPTSGDASAIDSYTYVIIKTASATYTVLASVTKFA